MCGNNRNLQVSELRCCRAEFGAYCCDVLEYFSAPGLRGINSLIFHVMKNSHSGPPGRAVSPHVA